MQSHGRRLERQKTDGADLRVPERTTEVSVLKIDQVRRERPLTGPERQVDQKTHDPQKKTKADKRGASITIP
ncbi:MAG: hypothetical protein NVSMB9_27560 [Isosphaeraceae bacterium]